MTFTAERSLNRKWLTHTPSLCITSFKTTKYSVPTCKWRTLSANSVYWVERRRTLTSSINMNLVWSTDRCIEDKRRTCSSIKRSSLRTSYTNLANQVESLQTATSSSIPFGIRTAKLTDWHALMFVVRTHNKTNITLFLCSASNSIPKRTNWTSPTESWSYLIIPLIASTRNSVEPTVMRTCGNRRLHWLTYSIIHEISTLTDTIKSIPISIDGTIGYNFTSSHDILISFKTDTCFLNLTVDHILSTYRNSNIDTNSIIISTISIQANTLYSIEYLIVVTWFTLTIY